MAATGVTILGPPAPVSVRPATSYVIAPSPGPRPIVGPGGAMQPAVVMVHPASGYVRSPTTGRVLLRTIGPGGNMQRGPVLSVGPPPFVPYRGRFARRPQPGFGSLGLNSAEDSVVAGAAGKAAAVGATALLTSATAGSSAMIMGATIGSVVPIIGTVVGAVVGLAVGALLNKQYLNVAQANAGEDNAVAAFNQYRSIAGQVPGRQFGVDAMNAVWNGAVYSGLFPLNKGQACFHDGCLKYKGDPDWVWGTFHDGANNPFTFAYAYQQWSQQRQANAIQAGATSLTPAMARTMAMSRVPAAFRGLGRMGMDLTGGRSAGMVDFPTRFSDLGMDLSDGRSVGMVDFPSRFSGLGNTSAPVADAVSFIDQFFIPNSTRDNPPWAVPQSPLEHQILYDAADAWLATQPIVTTPYVASQGSGVATPVVLPATSSTQIPGVIPTSGGTVSIYNGNPNGTTAMISPPVTPGAQTPLAPTATPLLPSTPTAIAAGSGVATSAAAATQANLDAAMAAQGFTRVGTNSSGFPLYAQAGMVYAYQNGQLFASGTVAQLAVTGNAGTGISTPATGIDPNTLAAIVGALQAGATQPQAAAAGASVLASQGVPITPDVQDQLNAAASQPAVPQGPSSSMILIGIAAVVGVVLLTGSKKAA